MVRRRFLLSSIASMASGAVSLRWSMIVDNTFVDEIRAAFPRLTQETYLNAAGMMPLGAFSKAGLERYIAYQELGSEGERGAYAQEVFLQSRAMFASLIGAREEEIGLVHCTKAGEQLLWNSLGGLRDGKNIVTNDLHFSGSLHQYTGMQKAGVDVRVVRARDWKVRLEDMEAAIDERTALVAVSLVSNINGHLEDVATLSEMAHRHGALLYADIIQAAGIVPVDVEAMGIDVAACSCYKWLYGVHGTGFVYVRKSVQEGPLADRYFPGHVRHNYEPWVDLPDPEDDALGYMPPADARRYQPGHVSYLGYCAAYEGMKFIQEYGMEKALAHSRALNQRLRDALNPDVYPCISDRLDQSPIATFMVPDPEEAKKRLAEEKIVVSFSGNRMRVSPAVYNNEADIDRLVGVLQRN